MLSHFPTKKVRASLQILLPISATGSKPMTNPIYFLFYYIMEPRAEASRDWQNGFVFTTFRCIEEHFHTLLLLGRKISFVIPRTLLIVNRGSTVL